MLAAGFYLDFQQRALSLVILLQGAHMAHCGLAFHRLIDCDGLLYGGVVTVHDGMVGLFYPAMLELFAQAGSGSILCGQ